MAYSSREGYSVGNINYMKQFARRIPSEKNYVLRWCKIYSSYILVEKRLREWY